MVGSFQQFTLLSICNIENATLKVNESDFILMLKIALDAK